MTKMFNIETIVSKYVQIKSAKITILMGRINCEFIQEIHQLIENLIMFGIHLESLYIYFLISSIALHTRYDQFF